MILYLLIFNLLFSNAFNIKFNNWFDLNSNLKNKARNWFIQRAEKKGISWNLYKNQYIDNADDIFLIKDLTSNNFLYYPDYYKKPFHGYDNGNLNWDAAFEGVGATLSMSSNYWIDINPKQSHSWLRNNYTNNIKDYYSNLNKSTDSLNILDVGCSVGISTESLYRKLKPNKITGIDLSPFFIAISKFRASKQNLPIIYEHNNAEYLPFKNKNFNLICAQFLFHEVPKDASLNILKECYRTLENDGVISIIDLDPYNLIDNPFFKFFRKMLFEVTEPHIKEYYKTNMTELLIDVGFKNVVKVSNNDPFNSVWLGSKEDNKFKLKKYIQNKIDNQDKLIQDNNFLIDM